MKKLIIIAALAIAAGLGCIALGHYQDEQNAKAADAARIELQKDFQGQALETKCVDLKTGMVQHGYSLQRQKLELESVGFNLDCTAKVGR